MSSDAKNLQYLDTLRALAMLAVIIIHVASPLMNMNYSRNMEFWLIGLIFNNFMRFAVPTFLLISGATLLTKRYGTLDFYKRRMSRVLIPASFWLPAYWIFRWFMLRPWERPRNFDSIINWGVDLFAREGISKHLWFVYMILLLYVFMPLMGKILHRVTRKTIVLFLILWLILNHLQSFGVISTDSFSLLFKKLYVYTLYSGYLVLGYYLQTLKPNCKFSRIYALLLYLTAVLITLFLTYYLSSLSGKQTLTAMGAFTINTVIQVIAIYYIVKDFEVKNRFVAKLIQTISNYSFGIYLVHIMVISLFFRIGIFWTMAHPLISVPLVVFLTLITSFIVIFLLRKIPFIAKFAG